MIKRVWSSGTIKVNNGSFTENIVDWQECSKLAANTAGATHWTYNTVEEKCILSGGLYDPGNSYNTAVNWITGYAGCDVGKYLIKSVIMGRWGSGLLKSPDNFKKVLPLDKIG